MEQSVATIRTDNKPFSWRITGDSMSPRYAGGSLLACVRKEPSTPFRFGKAYVIKTRTQGVIVRRIQQGETANRLLCVADNKAYSPFELPAEEVEEAALVLGGITIE